MKNKFVIQTANGNYMSEVFTLNGLDFETRHLSDAKTFRTQQAAEEFINRSGFDRNFVFVSEI